MDAPPHSFYENETFPATADYSEKLVISNLHKLKTKALYCTANRTEIESRSHGTIPRISGKYPRICLNKLASAHESSKLTLFLFAKKHQSFTFWEHSRPQRPRSFWSAPRIATEVSILGADQKKRGLWGRE